MNEIPSWLGEARGRLKPTRGLPTNWNSYWAEPVSERAIQVAITVLRAVMPGGGPIAQIVPTTPGEYRRHGKQEEICTPGLNYADNCTPAGSESGIRESPRPGSA